MLGVLIESVLMATLAVVNAGAAQESAQESCSVIAGDPEKIVSVPTLRVMEQTAGGDFLLPPGTPANVKAIQCHRASIIPVENDYKVLLAGFPFIIIVDDGRLAVMEVSEHRLQFRTLEGEFSDTEIPAISAYVDYAQPLLNVPDDGT